MRRRVWTLLFVLVIPSPWAWGRPLITEEVETVGKYSFEVGFGLSRRNDSFNSPKLTYETVTIPVVVRLGVTEKTDIGFTLDSYTHRIDAGGAEYTGSRTSLVSPHIKFSPWKNVGFLGVVHMKHGEHGDQELPIARGDQIEVLSLVKFPFAWPMSLNVGYLFRGSYHSKFGISDAQPAKIEPGNVFESRLSAEIPLKFHFSILGEAAYYIVDKKSINSLSIRNSNGSATDLLVGLTWNYLNWNLGGGVGFGVGEESHTSFDLDRGAGDTLYSFKLAYKLLPRRPGRAQ